MKHFPKVRKKSDIVNFLYLWSEKVESETVLNNFTRKQNAVWAAIDAIDREND